MKNKIVYYGKRSTRCTLQSASLIYTITLTRNNSKKIEKFEKKIIIAIRIFPFGDLLRSWR